MKQARDSRDTFVNGFLTGLAIPIIFFFLLQAVGKLLATLVLLFAVLIYFWKSFMN